MFPNPTSSHPLRGISGNGDSTTVLGSLYQCLTTVSREKFSLISNRNLPWHNLRPEARRKRERGLCVSRCDGCEAGQPTLRGYLWAPGSEGAADARFAHQDAATLWPQRTSGARLNRRLPFASWQSLSWFFFELTKRCFEFTQTLPEIPCTLTPLLHLLESTRIFEYHPSHTVIYLSHSKLLLLPPTQYFPCILASKTSSAVSHRH